MIAIQPFFEQGKNPYDEADRLGEEIARVGANISAATHVFLTLLRKFDEHGGWYKHGAHSCAHWLTWRVGMGPCTASEHVRIAKALGTLPSIDAALSKGELSYCKVRAITRVAKPETEQVLLDLARCATGAQLEKICSQYRAAATQERKTATEHQVDEDQRYVRHQYTSSGMVKIEALLHADEADVVLRALEAAKLANGGKAKPDAASPTDEQAPALSAGKREPPSTEKELADFLDCVEPSPKEEPPPQPQPIISEREVREAEDDDDPDAPQQGSVRLEKPTQDANEARSKADALLRIAESYLAAPHDERNAGARVQMVVHIDHEALQPNPKPGLRIELEDHTPLAPATARRLACDASLIAIIEDKNGTPLSVGRKTRTIPPSIRRALQSRDQGCRYPGCNHKRFLDPHHIEHWADGGKTELSNLLLLCRRHHRLHHEENYQIKKDPQGNLEFINRNGTKLSPTAKIEPVAPDDLQAILDKYEGEAHELDPNAGLPLGNLECDYPMAIGAIFSAEEAYRRKHGNRLRVD